MVVIIIGAAGAGKSTIGAALAAALGWRFLDADDFHAADNIDRMRGGIGLTDEERGPWLARVRQAILDHVAKRQPVVVACSALKRRYRDVLTEGVDDARLVYLRADETLLRDRLEQRRGHFAGAGLATTQLRDLEVPHGEALTVDASRPPDVLVDEIRRALNL
ncbi:MAG TPA: gluconokinase, GntK/IdnK-type [Vicinamibacterales bacterium]|nr:gluconokinase, GntK/IdnK-type [Vicinamibacterales bacterium]